MNNKEILKDFEKQKAYKKFLKKPEIVNLVLDRNNDKIYLKYKKCTSPNSSFNKVIIVNKL